MKFISWNLLFATWLLFSTFLFDQSFDFMFLTLSSALAIAMLAFGAAGRPGMRYVISLIALGLALASLRIPDVSWAARLNVALVAALLFALSLVSPQHGPDHEAHHAIQGF